MKKYWTIIKNVFQMQLTYRANITAYMFGNLMELFVPLAVWTAVYKNIETISGYSRTEMITYLVVGWFVAFLTTTYDLQDVMSKDIKMGTLSNFIVKPMSYLRYMSAVAVGRKTIATINIAFGQTFLILFFRHDLIYQLTASGLSLFLIMILFGFIIRLFVDILVGTISLWTTEVSGVYYSIKMAVNFLSGMFFPITILPEALAAVNRFLPFMYAHFIPVQFYLGKIDFHQAMVGILIQLFWIAVLYGIIKFVWRLGLKKYESAGI